MSLDEKTTDLPHGLPQAIAAAAGVARRLAVDDALEDRLEAFEELRWDGGEVPWPTLQIDDFSAIPFLVDVTGVEEYQHRARLRARPGDLYTAVTRRTEGYEEYCVERLGLPPAGFERVEPVADRLALATAWLAGGGLSRLVDRARDAGGLGLHPFMGTEEIWSLARRIAKEAGTPATVVGPPPPVTWIANDKLAFSDLVARVLGDEWLVETRACTDPGSLAAALWKLAARHPRVAVKRLRCASAMGNRVWDSATLRALGLPGVEQEVEAFLDRTEWAGDERVLAVVWEDTELSPSTQTWIPPSGRGEPVVNGIYEQILSGEHRVFVGSRPSTLPERANRAIGAASLALATSLQALGYAGRCSFDLLLLGDPEGDFRLKFVECNGRWGGTSTPMALLDRLLGAPRPPYRAQDFVRPELVGASFREILEAVGDEAWDATSGRGRYLFYNTGPLPGFGKIDVIALARSQPEAETALEEGLPRLLGLA